MFTQGTRVLLEYFTSKKDRFDIARGPGGWLLPGLLGSAVPDTVRDCPRGPADLNGTGLTAHPVLGGLDRASSAVAPGTALPPASLQSRPIAPNPPDHSALQCRPNSNHPPGPFQRSAVFSALLAQQPGWCMWPMPIRPFGLPSVRNPPDRDRAEGTSCTISPRFSP